MDKWNTRVISIVSKLVEEVTALVDRPKTPQNTVSPDMLEVEPRDIQDCVKWRTIGRAQ